MKRCKCCKDKFEAKFPFQKYCMQKDICISKHIEVIRDKQKQQRYKSWVKKKKEISPIVYPKKFKGYLQD